MPHYLLSVIEPSEGERPSPEELEEVMARVGEYDRELRDAGVWVFSGGLHPPATASTLRPSGDEILVTDGPFAEGKEHLGGFTIIDVPDLDAALDWGRKAVAATTLPIEVRPFWW